MSDRHSSTSQSSLNSYRSKKLEDLNRKLSHRNSAEAEKKSFMEQLIEIDKELEKRAHSSAASPASSTHPTSSKRNSLRNESRKSSRVSFCDEANERQNLSPNTGHQNESLDSNRSDHKSVNDSNENAIKNEAETRNTELDIDKILDGLYKPLEFGALENNNAKMNDASLIESNSDVSERIHSDEKQIETKKCSKSTKLSFKNESFQSKISSNKTRAQSKYLLPKIKRKTKYEEEQERNRFSLHDRAMTDEELLESVLRLSSASRPKSQPPRFRTIHDGAKLEGADLDKVFARLYKIKVLNDSEANSRPINREVNINTIIERLVAKRETKIPDSRRTVKDSASKNNHLVNSFAWRGYN